MPLAKRATRSWFNFTNHWGVAHCSDPNHAALFTGYGPWQTKVTTQMGSLFKDSLPTIFWKWKKLVGGTTWAVQPALVPEFYRQYMDVIAWHKTSDSGDLELRAVKKFLSERDESKPWCGFIRDMTLHYPYLEQPMPKRGSGGDIIPLYNRAAEHVDRFVHNLIELILSDFPDTIIAICADHGELLGERYGSHGAQWDHLWSLHNVLVKTPMALYVPGIKGKRTDQPTQHVDLLPTVCDLLGWEQQGEGVSWANWLRGDARHPAPPDRLLWLQGTGAGNVSDRLLKEKGQSTIDPDMEKHVLWRHSGVVQGRVKLVQNVYANGRGDEILVDSRDYKEARNGRVSDKVRGRLLSRLPPFPDYHEWEQAIIDKAMEPQARAYDQVILQRLEALGYA
jgi:hypothetical protein